MAFDGQLDSRIEVVTPENIAFQYRVAGPFRRLPAFAIDGLIRLGIVVGCSLLLQVLFERIGAGGLGTAVFLVILFVVSWFYGGLFETFWNGQTPGKRLMGLRVLSIDGQPIDALQAVMRNILREVDAMPYIWIPGVLEGPLAGPVMPIYFLGLISPLLTSRYQRLGDLACGTMVVVEDGQSVYGVTRLTEPEAIRLAAYLPVHLQVSRSLARALSDYVERRGFFSQARRIEIARHVGEPLRLRYNFPADTNYDRLLCALYYRTFIADRVEADDRPARGTAAGIGPQQVAIKAR